MAKFLLFPKNALSKSKQLFDQNAFMTEKRRFHPLFSPFTADQLDLNRLNGMLMCVWAPQNPEGV